MVSWQDYWPQKIWNDMQMKKIGAKEVITFPDLPLSLAHALNNSANRFRDKTAIVDNWHNKYTYASLMEMVNKFASYLHWELHIQKGSHVALMLYNSIEFCVAFLALNKLGAITVPLPVKYQKQEVLSLAKKANVSFVICEEQFAGWFEFDQGQSIPCIHPLNHEKAYGFEYLFTKDFPQVDTAGTLEDSAFIIFTSGTTSKSKGVLLKNYNVMHAIVAYQRTLQIDCSDKTIIPIPIYLVTGMVALLGLFLFAGGTVYLHKYFDAKRVLQCAVDEKITFLHASPTVFSLLLSEKEQFPKIPTLRSFACGSSNMPPENIRRIKKWLPNVDFHTVYGLTETSSPATLLPNGAADSPYIGSSGVPVPGNQLKIVDKNGMEQDAGKVGEVLVSGSTVLEEYYQLQSEAITPDGWLHTGDLGYCNEHGYLFIVDRIKDMINRGGEKICSFDVENQLNCLNGILEAAVVGIPDKKYGEVPVAAVQSADPNWTQEKIQETLKTKLAKYQIPIRIQFFDKIPKTPNGKIDKKTLRQLFIDQMNDKEELQIHVKDKLCYRTASR